MLGTLQDLAKSLGARVVGDGATPIARIAAVDEATPDALTFAVEEKYLAAALAGKAGAVLVDASIPFDAAGAGKPLLVVENARLALARLLETLRAPRPRGPFRHATAVVEEGAVLADDAYLGANAYVGRARASAAAASWTSALTSARIPRSAKTRGCSRGRRSCKLQRRRSRGAARGCVIGSEGFDGPS